MLKPRYISGLLMTCFGFCGAALAGNSVTDAAGDIRFHKATACIETAQRTVKLQVELAETAEQRARGLMERDSLPDDAGMLFRYPEPQPASHGFWMYRTRIPLDVAFLNADGRVLSIRNMTPCTAAFSMGCTVYRAGEAYQGALEVNQGYFEAQEIKPGSRVYLASEDSCSSRP